MALKPTIYKFRISLSDLERHYYDTLNLTVAQHPSETVERMVARVLAFCLSAEAGLEFSKGLCEPDEPDIWIHALDGGISRWIEVGEPAFDRIKKACRLSGQVAVYSFNAKSDTWWAQNREKFSALPVAIYQFSWADIQKVASLVNRVMDMSVTISGDYIHVAAEDGEREFTVVKLQ